MENPYEPPGVLPETAPAKDLDRSRNLWFSVRIVVALPILFAFLESAHAVRYWDGAIWEALAGPFRFAVLSDDLWFFAFLGALACFVGVGSFVFWPRRRTALIALLAIAAWAAIGLLH